MEVICAVVALEKQGLGTTDPQLKQITQQGRQLERFIKPDKKEDQDLFAERMAVPLTYRDSRIFFCFSRLSYRTRLQRADSSLSSGSVCVGVADIQRVSVLRDCRIWLGIWQTGLFHQLDPLLTSLALMLPFVQFTEWGNFNCWPKKDIHISILAFNMCLHYKHIHLTKPSFVMHTFKIMFLRTREHFCQLRGKL